MVLLLELGHAPEDELEAAELLLALELLALVVEELLALVVEELLALVVEELLVALLDDAGVPPCPPAPCELDAALDELELAPPLPVAPPEPETSWRSAHATATTVVATAVTTNHRAPRGARAPTGGSRKAIRSLLEERCRPDRGRGWGAR